MEEPANNHAVERKMKEALKKDRSRVQVGKMSCFGLLEISRQRMHSSFMESNYIVCPHCNGQGVVRTVESGAVLVLRGIEEEGIRNRSAQINVFVPTDVAIYLLNQKRADLVELEQKYHMGVIISADDSIKNIADYRIEKVRAPKSQTQEKKAADEMVAQAQEIIENVDFENSDNSLVEENLSTEDNNFHKGRRERIRNRREKGRKSSRGRRNYENETSENFTNEEKTMVKEKQEAIILYNSHGNTTSKTDEEKSETKPAKEKSTWWKKLIKG